MRNLRRSLRIWSGALKKVRAVVIDTTYLLPFFGVEVKGIELNDLYNLINSLRSMGVEFIYPKPMLIELLAKLFREAEKRSMKQLPEHVWVKLRALLLSGEVVLEDLTLEDMKVIEKLRLSGFKDLFNCIAYAIARRLGGILLTMDRKFKEFITVVGEDPNIIKDHNELAEMLKNS